MAPATRATKISKDVAMARFVETTIGLLEKLPIADVSDRLIAESAGINRASLYRYFNTRHELFDLVLEEVSNRYLDDLKTATAAHAQPVNTGQLSVDVLAPTFALSSQVFAIGNYLVAGNYRSDRLTSNMSKIVEVWTQQFLISGVAPRMARALALQALGLGFGRPNAESLIRLEHGDVVDVFRLMINSMQNHAEMTAKFGWAETQVETQ